MGKEWEKVKGSIRFDSPKRILKTVGVGKVIRKCREEGFWKADGRVIAKLEYKGKTLLDLCEPNKNSSISNYPTSNYPKSNKNSKQLAQTLYNCHQTRKFPSIRSIRQYRFRIVSTRSLFRGQEFGFDGFALVHSLR